MNYLNTNNMGRLEVAYASKALASLVQFSMSYESENNPMSVHGETSYGIWLVLEMVKEGIDHLSANDGAAENPGTEECPAVRRVA